MEQLFRAHWPLLYGYLLRQTRDRELAQDLAQDTFVKAARSISGWRGESAAGWLEHINLILAGFNLLPGFPLDGGRMLRAAAWGVTKDLHRATRIASTAGSAIAFGLIGWGIVRIIWSRSLVEGLWFGLIGWFLLLASRQSVGQMELRENLRRLPRALRLPRAGLRGLPG